MQVRTLHTASSSRCTASRPRSPTTPGASESAQVGRPLQHYSTHVYVERSELRKRIKAQTLRAACFLCADDVTLVDSSRLTPEVSRAAILSPILTCRYIMAELNAAWAAEVKRASGHRSVRSSPSAKFEQVERLEAHSAGIELLQKLPQLLSCLEVAVALRPRSNVKCADPGLCTTPLSMQPPASAVH